MRRWLLILALAACGGGGSDLLPLDAAVDGSIDAPPWMPPGCSPSVPTPTCAMACGDDQIEMCWDYTVSPMDGCRQWFPRQERCDGTARASCTQAGYYGGETSCPQCVLVTSACDACAPNTTRCAAHAGFPIFQDGLAASGSHVAILGENKVAIDDGTGLTLVNIPEVDAIVGVPGGWLVAHGIPTTFTPLDTAGALGTPLSTTIDTGVTLTYGPGGRVLVATSQEIAGEQHVRVHLADTTGATVVAPFTLFPSERRVSLTTDGTSFFVGGSGSLARVAPDGTHSITSGFPFEPFSQEQVRIVWSGSTGWYVTSGNFQTNHAIHVQRFDAAGALVGSPFDLSLVATTWSFAADGNDLLAVRYAADTGPSSAPSRLELVRIDAAGTIGTPVELGAGTEPVQVTRLGSDLFVAWGRSSLLQLARIAP